MYNSYGCAKAPYRNFEQATRYCVQLFRSSLSFGQRVSPRQGPGACPLARSRRHPARSMTITYTSRAETRLPRCPPSRSHQSSSGFFDTNMVSGPRWDELVPPKKISEFSRNPLSDRCPKCFHIFFTFQSAKSDNNFLSCATLNLSKEAFSLSGSGVAEDLSGIYYVNIPPSCCCDGSRR
jgi:hypothetical protein